MEKHLAILTAGTLSLFALSPSASADTYFNWTGSGSNNSFSTAENWSGNFAPSGNSSSGERLFFEGVPSTVVNDLAGASFEELFFSDGSYVYHGNTANIAQLTLSTRTLNASDVWIGADIRGSDIFFDYDDFRVDQSNAAYLQFGVGGEIQLTSSVANRFSTYGDGSFASRVVLGGTSGRIISNGPAEAWIGGATLALNGGDQPSVSGRIGSNVHVYLDQGSQLKLNAFSGEAANFTETISQLTLVGSAILNVDRGSNAHDTILSIPANIASAGLALYNTSNGELGAASGPAPRIMLQGQTNSSFLGAQQFYLNGNVNWGGGYAPYQFAGYDTLRGVVSATTLNNPNDLATSTLNDVVQIDAANPAALADHPDASHDYKLTTDATVKALAFNGDLLYSNVEGQTGPLKTITLEHLLVTHDSAAIAVNLNFGSSAGTITTENWFSNNSPEVDVLADIGGTNSLTFRGEGELNYRAAASFSGELNIKGGNLNIADAGRFSNVGTINLGNENGVSSSLELYGVDNTGPGPVAVNRLRDDVHITVEGNSLLSLESDAAGVSPLSERVGSIVVAGPGTEFSLVVQAGDLDTHSASSAAKWVIDSLAFDASASDSLIHLAAYGAGNTITVNGGPIILQNGNALSVTQQAGGFVVTSGVGIAAGSTAVFALSGALEGNVNLQGGNFEVSGASTSIVGDLTMGTELQTWLALPSLADDAEASFFRVLDVPSPVVSIEGNLTLGGTINISQGGAFQLGSWLLFEYSGELIEDQWTLNGLDGEYTLTVNDDLSRVYLNAVPEPTTWALIAGGGLILLTFSYRMRRG